MYLRQRLSAVRLRTGPTMSGTVQRVIVHPRRSEQSHDRAERPARRHSEHRGRPRVGWLGDRAPGRRPNSIVAAIIVAAAAVALAVVADGHGSAGAEAGPGSEGRSTQGGVERPEPDPTWLALNAADAAEVLNFYRTANGLPPVDVDLGLSRAAWDHSCWMADNDTLGHYRAGASTGAAGEMSNIAVGRSPLYPDSAFVELWLTGPYHAVSMLRWGLETIGYARCTADGGLWRSGSTMDVINGFQRRRSEGPVLFPPAEHTTDLIEFKSERPNPLENCGWTSAGLPVFAMLPEPPRASTTGVLRGPDGVVETCLITALDDVTSGRTILRFDNVVVLVPAEPLTDGRWEVEIDTGRRQLAWGFWVGDERRVGPPPEVRVSAEMPATRSIGAPSRLVTTQVERTLDTRIPGRPPQVSPDTEWRVPVGTPPPGATAVALTLTAADHRHPGWAAVYPCEAGYQGTSTVNVAPGIVGANSTIVPLDATRDDGGATLCARVSTAMDLIVDVSGWFVDDVGAGFVPAAERVVDSRSDPDVPGLRAGGTLTVEVAEPGTAAVAVNVTTTFTQSDGFLTLWPCDQPRRETSVSQSTVGMTRAATAIVPVAADGTICIYSSSATQVIVDLQGVFVDSAGADFVPVVPVRAVDTRSGPHPWSSTAGRVRGRGEAEQGVTWALPGLPGDTVALATNLTVTSTSDAAWIAMHACDGWGGQSNLNASFLVPAVPNQAVVEVVDGRSCLRIEGTAHLIVDVTGAFVGPGR